MAFYKVESNSDAMAVICSCSSTKKDESRLPVLIC